MPTNAAKQMPINASLGDSVEPLRSLSASTATEVTNSASCADRRQLFDRRTEYIDLCDLGHPDRRYPAQQVPVMATHGDSKASLPPCAKELSTPADAGPFSMSMFKNSEEYWKNEAQRYCANVDFWRGRCEIYEKALNQIAAWQDGEKVTSRFDEPGSAEIARNALA